MPNISNAHFCNKSGDFQRLYSQTCYVSFLIYHSRFSSHFRQCWNPSTGMKDNQKKRIISPLNCVLYWKCPSGHHHPICIFCKVCIKWSTSHFYTLKLIWQRTFNAYQPSLSKSTTSKNPARYHISHHIHSWNVDKNNCSLTSLIKVWAPRGLRSKIALRNVSR